MTSRDVNKEGKIALHFSSESHKAAVNAYVSSCNPERQLFVDTLTQMPTLKTNFSLLRVMHPRKAMTYC